jgi:RES domain-containing protein
VLTTWRLIDEQYANDAFGGEGARRKGGRWNSRGYWVVYTSATASLAALEFLANATHRKLLAFVVIASCTFDESLVTSVDIDELPVNWWEPKAPRELQEIGDEWIRSERSAVLSVPSVIVEHERNYLLNPVHADFKRIKLSPAKPFRFDLRLFT